MRILAFHLLNDFSGSPKVLRQLLGAWAKDGKEVHLFTAGGRDGFLSGIDGIQYHKFWYRWHGHPLVRLVTYSISQLLLFLLAFNRLKKEDLVYINTVLPFGAALAAKLRGCRIVYHLHETTVNPPVLKTFLFGLVKWASTEVVCVSQYMANTLHPGFNKIHILYNSLEKDFSDQVRRIEKREPKQNVLMVCSLKWYKGVDQFVQLACVLSFYRFRLVLNASEKEIKGYFKETSLPENLEIFPTQPDVHPHYQWADLVLNLSHPDGWVETFGLTVVEAMAYHLPVIVPTVGGIAELVADGKNGYRMDCRNQLQLSRTIMDIFQNPKLYKALQAGAQETITAFHEESFITRSRELLKI